MLPEKLWLSHWFNPGITHAEHCSMCSMCSFQFTAVPKRAQWSSCPHPTEMLRRAFTPVGSRKCGGVSQSNVGRKTTTTTPANLPPGGVSCRGVGMVASFQAETAAVWSIWPLIRSRSRSRDISVCLAGLAGVLGERRILGVSRGALGLWYHGLRACAGILGERAWVVGLVVHFPFRRHC